MQLKLQFCHFAEVVFPNLVALIANSVKVISSCGLVTIDFLLQVSLVCFFLLLLIMRKKMFYRNLPQNQSVNLIGLLLAALKSLQIESDKRLLRVR